MKHTCFTFFKTFEILDVNIFISYVYVNVYNNHLNITISVGFLEKLFVVLLKKIAFDEE